METIAIAFSDSNEAELKPFLGTIQKNFQNEIFLAFVPLSVFITERNECVDIFIGIYSRSPTAVAYLDIRSRIQHSAGSTPPKLIELLKLILSSFHGVVFDEWTDHAWTLDEIVGEHLVEGHPFFDREGWSEEFQKKRPELYGRTKGTGMGQASVIDGTETRRQKPGP
jgi:hypothetical protein